MATSDFKIGYRMSGFDQLASILDDLPDTMKRRIVVDAVGEACKPVRTIARAKIRNRTGALRRSLAISVKSYPSSGTVLGMVGPDKDYYQGGKRLKKGASAKGADRPANYAHNVEFGHYSGAVRGGGSVRRLKDQTIRRGSTDLKRGYVPAHPFIRPAAAQGEGPATAALVDGINTGMAREILRLNRKHRRLIKSMNT